MTAVAKIAPASPVAVARGADMLTDTSQFELAQRWANAFANSQLVPAHLRGKTADCLIGLMMAKELGAFPGYAADKANMLRVMKNHRAAARGAGRRGRRARRARGCGARRSGHSHLARSAHRTVARDRAFR